MDYYEQKELWDRELTNQEIERIDIIKKFILDDVESILDAGCGNGAIANSLVGFDVTAMDRSVEALKYVKNAKKIQGSLDNIPFKDNSFDLVICSDVLEHLPEDIYKKTIAELKRVSKKYILIISPNNEDLCANQSKCIKCGTVFHMNWHINSFCIDDIICDFRDDFAPVLYSFFGDKWASEPSIKYTLARTTGRGYKHWENAICPMCGSKQNSFLENTTDIDIECNKFLNGFYNNSTEFIVLLSTIENKKRIFDFDDIEKKNILLSQSKIKHLSYANRQSAMPEYDCFNKEHTEFYPQHAYFLNSTSSDDFNRMLVCFPYLKNNNKVYFEYQDNINANVLVNVYDLEKKFINIGEINLSDCKDYGKVCFEISDSINPANEGLILELISDNKSIFEKSFIKRIYLNDNFGDICITEYKEVNFCSNKYFIYEYAFDACKKEDEIFLVLDKNVLLCDKKNRCFFINLFDTFEFFALSRKQKQEINLIKDEVYKQNNALKQEINLIKDEVYKQNNALKQEINLIKDEVYKLNVGVCNVSNCCETLKARIQSPLKFIYGKLKHKFISRFSLQEDIQHHDTCKHLIVITPDVKIDRRTVQMCQSLIKTYDIKCTIIAALEEKDDFITDKLKVKRVDPYKTKKYIRKLNDWSDDNLFNLEDFYWLHSYYLSVALNESADYIMCCDLPLLPCATYISKFKNIPLIYDAHELYPEQAIFSKEKRDFYTQVEAHFIKYPNLVITVNESIAKEMSKRYGINKPEVILNALDAPKGFDQNKKYDHFRNALSISKDKKIVLFQGGYSPNRNLELFVKSAKYIKDDNLVLVLMGFGDFKQVLENTAVEDKTINNKVFFFPAVDQSILLEYSASADVGIIPYPHVDLNSYYCTPNKLFEFIQAGLPMIANDSPELNRFIKDNQIGYSYKINDEKDIAYMIEEFFKQDIDYKQNILNIRDIFSWKTEERKFIEIMSEIIS